MLGNEFKFIRILNLIYLDFKFNLFGFLGKIKVSSRLKLENTVLNKFCSYGENLNFGSVKFFNIVLYYWLYYSL
jgi:hypothetical protein